MQDRAERRIGSGIKEISPKVRAGTYVVLGLVLISILTSCDKSDFSFLTRDLEPFRDRAGQVSGPDIVQGGWGFGETSIQTNNPHTP